MLKILGAALLVLCGALLGLGRLGRGREELKFLADMDNALGLMAGEIELCARPLPELFALLTERVGERAAGFFTLARTCCVDMSAAEAWERCCRHSEVPERLRSAIMPLTAVLGSYDARRQCAEIELARRALASEEEKLRRELGTCGRSWPALGACLAGVAAMLII